MVVQASIFLRRSVQGPQRSRFPSEDHAEDEMAEILREKTLLEKVGLSHHIIKKADISLQRLNQALVNNEVTEVSNKTILHELQEARVTISRLTAQHARSLGWEARLATHLQEKDDMQQERDGESNRAKLAESRLAAMKDKTGPLSLFHSFLISYCGNSSQVAKRG